MTQGKPFPQELRTEWGPVIKRSLTDSGDHVDGVIVDAPWVYVIRDTVATRCWCPQTLGPVTTGEFTLQRVPENARFDQGQDTEESLP